MKDLAHKLTTASRPAEVARWIARARKYDRPPTIDDLVAYGEDMRAWYTAAMPKWRQGDFEWPLLRVAPNGLADWYSIRRGGANGIVVFVIALSWWKAKADQEQNATAAGEVASMIEDLTFALPAMHGAIA